MARGTTLLILRKMLKAECGIELDETVSSSEDAKLNLMLSNQQKWLVGQHAFLFGKVRKDVALAAGTRFHTFPESDLDIDRVDPEAVVKVGTTNPVRYNVHFGIGQEQYVTWDSEATPPATVDPVMRWDLVNDGGTLKIEVWPVPETATQTLALSGYRPLPALAVNTDVAVLDDLLIVLFCAAEYLGRRGDKDAGAKLARAQAHLNALKGSRQSQFERFNMANGGNCARPRARQRPIIGVSNV